MKKKLTPSQKKQRQERLKKQADKELAEWTAGNRPGLARTKNREKNREKPLANLTLGEIEQIGIDILRPNPLNTYPPLTQEQIQELANDIKDKGVIVPLIAMPDGVLLCGHNRLLAARKAGLSKVPVQTVIRPAKLSESLQVEIMHSENDKRRGGRWSKAEKKAWVEKHFEAELLQERRGGRRGNQHAGGKKVAKTANGDFATLPEKIAKKSRGEISKRTAERLVAEIRKEKKPRPIAKKKQLEKRMSELAAQIRSLQKQILAKQAEYERLKKERAELK